MYLLSYNVTTKQFTEVRFACFLSGGFITATIVNPPERKLAKGTSVQRPKWPRNRNHVCTTKSRTGYLDWNQSTLKASLENVTKMRPKVLHWKPFYHLANIKWLETPNNFFLGRNGLEHSAVENFCRFIMK